MGCSGAIARVFSVISEVILDMWEFSSGILRFTSEVESTVTAAEVSMWRALWNDLFSQIFRALRSILNGFVAFFMACNRHRLRYGCRSLFCQIICHIPCNSTVSAHTLHLQYI
nr:Envelope glycoprotein like [Ipomoea batatas]